MKKMLSSELRQGFLLNFNKKKQEWSTTRFNKDTGQEFLPIKVKIEELIYVTLMFHQNEGATSCHFIDEITGEEKIFNNIKGWELSAYHQQQ